MSNSTRVGEIFNVAGNALNLLGELTKQLESAGSSGPGSGTKWSDQVRQNYPAMYLARCIALTG